MKVLAFVSAAILGILLLAVVGNNDYKQQQAQRQAQCRAQAYQAYTSVATKAAVVDNLLGMNAYETATSASLQSNLAQCAAQYPVQ